MAGFTAKSNTNTIVWFVDFSPPSKISKVSAVCYNSEKSGNEQLNGAPATTGKGVVFWGRNEGNSSNSPTKKTKNNEQRRNSMGEVTKKQKRQWQFWCAVISELKIMVWVNRVFRENKHISFWLLLQLRNIQNCSNETVTSNLYLSPFHQF